MHKKEAPKFSFGIRHTEYITMVSDAPPPILMSTWLSIEGKHIMGGEVFHQEHLMIMLEGRTADLYRHHRKKEL